MREILIINGPNLNLLENRERDIYGALSLFSIEEECQCVAEQLSIKIEFLQSNSESQLISWIQNCDARGLVINAAAYSHTSIAIMDALLMLPIPKIEVHISNIFKREQFRQKSYISEAVDVVICGAGKHSYTAALYTICGLLDCV
jgi:3-dehydroquinate dehydratase-2